MSDLPGKLGELVRRLDALRPEPTLINLANALKEANLSHAEVHDHVHENPRTYHRSYVVRREHYELLVLTWRPGQGSVPHDHAGSVSAMQVVQGEAAEGCWRIGADGYVDLEYEAAVRPGELTAWQDAGVHTVRNPPSRGDTLVTVNVYAPPLKDFRRYVPRPVTNSIRVLSNDDDRAAVIVVVGGGFSGAATAAQILRRAADAGERVRVHLIERQGAVGEGLAYSTRDLAHLLNVPAGRMSAWPDRPNDFVEWATCRHRSVSPGEFLPREWYGEYVRESLLAVAEETRNRVQFSVQFDEVRRMARRPGGGWMVNFAKGASLPADAVVLAIGHRPPPDPIGRLWSGPRARFIADPWRPFASNVITCDKPLIVLGSGLTAVDAVLSLASENAGEPLTLVSRRGLLPLMHAEQPAPAADLSAVIDDLLAGGKPVRIRELFQRVRAEARKLIADGHDWRAVVDGLRPHTSTLWNAMPLAERKKFFGRLRPYWEVHRHRMAPGVANQFNSLVASGRVKVVAGSVASAQADDDGVRLYIRERGDDRLRELSAGWVINCTGPAASNSAESNPAIGSLLVHGWVRPDALALGLDATLDGNAVDMHGAPAEDLFIVGTLRKPSLWESTAVPELRLQAAAVASRVVQFVAARSDAKRAAP